MPQKPIPYSSMSIASLLAAYNELAPPRGKATLKRWADSRCKLIERLAILRTLKLAAKPKCERPAEIPKPQSKQPVRDAMLKTLSVVTHYEDRRTGEKISKRKSKNFKRRLIVSVGLSYSDCAKMVKRISPTSKVTCSQLRFTASMVKSRERPGFSKCILPDKRPHSTRN